MASAAPICEGGGRIGSHRPGTGEDAKISAILGQNKAVDLVIPAFLAARNKVARHRGLERGRIPRWARRERNGRLTAETEAQNPARR